jgi:hypothetical protein
MLAAQVWTSNDNAREISKEASAATEVGGCSAAEMSLESWDAERMICRIGVGQQR